MRYEILIINRCSREINNLRSQLRDLKINHERKVIKLENKIKAILDRKKMLKEGL